MRKASVLDEQRLTTYRGMLASTIPKVVRRDLPQATFIVNAPPFSSENIAPLSSIQDQYEAALRRPGTLNFENERLSLESGDQHAFDTRVFDAVLPARQSRFHTVEHLRI